MVNGFWTICPPVLCNNMINRVPFVYIHIYYIYVCVARGVSTGRPHRRAARPAWSCLLIWCTAGGARERARSWPPRGRESTPHLAIYLLSATQNELNASYICARKRRVQERTLWAIARGTAAARWYNIYTSWFANLQTNDAVRQHRIYIYTKHTPWFRFGMPDYDFSYTRKTIKSN